MDQHFFTGAIEQHQCTDRESFALVRSRLEINLEAIDRLVIKCRGADRAAFAARLVAENIPSGKQLPATLAQCLGFRIPEGMLCCPIPGYYLPVMIHRISGFAGAENDLSSEHDFMTEISFKLHEYADGNERIAE